MLTVTYSLVAISAEQKTSRSILAGLQHAIRACLEKFQEPDFGMIRAALENLAQFDRFCHARKMEMYVIPAIRGVTRDMDRLLDELDSMSARGMAILRSAQEILRRAFTQGGDQLCELYRSLESYCENLSQRLAKEELELLPMVGRLLTTEQWFPIAAKFLSDEPAAKKRRPRTGKTKPGP